MTTVPDDTTHWIDNQGDIWALGEDGLMHTPETAPFSREYVEKKWGPLKPVATLPVGEQHTGTLNLTGEGNEAKSSGISDELVELGYKAIAAQYATRTETVEELMRRDARNVLEAAAPAIRQQVAEEIATTLDGCYASVQRLAEDNRQRSIDAGGRGTYEGDRFMRLAISQKNRASGLNGAATVAREIGGQR